MLSADKKSTTPVTVTLAEPGEDVEMKAISYVWSVLSSLDYTQRDRVLSYVHRRHEASAPPT